jgi:hypothetical protein
MKIGTRKQRLVFLSLILALLASISLVGGSTLAVVDQEMLTNGNFEGGFSHVPGCGTVGQGWGCFTNGGSVTYGFYDDQWAPVVADGAHSQLIELNTMQFAASEPDRFAGIYQTVHLVRGGTYQLRLSGLMREHNPDAAEDPYRYRVQWGYTTDGSTDWSAVTNWVELPWDKIDDRLSPTGMESYSTSFVAPSKNITLFFRVWKKWGTTHKELDVNLDAISLFGPAKKPPVRPDGPPPVEPPVEPPAVVACVGPNQIRNGSFEDGFTGGVGNYWTAYNNGGAAVYGFYDEMWPRVISDGAHGQLIEINTWGFAAADPDRFAGIYQVVHRLKPGATYEFALSGLLREEAAHPGEDGFRYRVQWGYAVADADPSEADITNWVELPWDEIYLRTDPGPMLDYSTRFQAPSKNVIIGVRAWKKWGTTNRELDVNLDAIRLSGCPGGVHPPKWPAKPDPMPDPKPGGKPAVVIVGKPAPANPSPSGAPTCSAWHIVVRGDTMSRIAARYGSSVAAIAKANNVANPNVIYIGQKLCIVP